MLKEVKFNTREDYLTEQSLGEFLSILFEGEEIIHNKKVKELGFRPDYYLPKRKLVVEFDGPFHFIDNKAVIANLDKNARMHAEKIKFVRIPYFIQLSKRNINILFGDIIKKEFKVINNFNSYKDGFIDKKVIMPGKFSTLGLQRVDDFYTRLINVKRKDSINLVLDIQESLIDRFVLQGYTYFECFPHTDFSSIKFHYQLLKDVYSIYQIDKDTNLIDLKGLKEYLEAMLNISLPLNPDPLVNEFTDIR